MSVIDTLIADRTQSDVDRVLSLAEKGWAAMTTAEQEEWLTGTKGACNVTDLNRVGEAMLYIADEMESYALSVTVTPRTDWRRDEIPTPEELDHYLADVATMRSIIDLPAGTPEVPENMERLTPEKANDIERILQVVHQMLLNIAAAWFYAGEIYAGEI